MDRRSKLLDLAAEYRAEATRHRATADTLDERAALLESMAGEAEEAAELSLTPDTKDDTKDTMSSTAIVAPSVVRKSRALMEPAHRKHPFAVALAKRKLSVKAFADQIKYPRTTVQSWYKSAGDDARPIPRDAAERIRDLLGVPLTAWRRLI